MVFGVCRDNLITNCLNLKAKDDVWSTHGTDLIAILYIETCSGQNLSKFGPKKKKKKSKKQKGKCLNITIFINQF